MHVIVTGSERGIGQAIAKEVCARGGYYYGFSRWNDIDVSDHECVKQAFDELRGVSDEHFPDVLVNNAGIVELGSILELSPEQWRRQFAVNLDGVFYCTKEYVRLVKSRQAESPELFALKPKVAPKIINIASTAGLGPRPGRSAYAASKAAMINFSLSMAEELRPYGIKVYCIAPGAVATDLRRQINPDDDFEAMMQPGELAKLVVDIAEGGAGGHSGADMLDNQVILARKP